MILGEALQIDEVYVGKWIYLSREAADNIDAMLEYFDQTKTYKVSGGCYYITNIDTSFVNPPGIAEHGKVAMGIDVMHEKWDPTDSGISPVQLILNKDASIILADSLLLSESLFSVIHDLDELIEANKKGYNCVACKQPLNIVFTNLRICNSCEEKFRNGTIERIPEGEEILDFEEDYDTIPLGIPAIP